MLVSRSLPVLLSVLFVFLTFLIGPAPVRAQFNYTSFPAPGLSFAGDGGFNGKCHPTDADASAAISSMGGGRLA